MQQDLAVGHGLIYVQSCKCSEFILKLKLKIEASCCTADVSSASLGTETVSHASHLCYAFSCCWLDGLVKVGSALHISALQ